MFQVGDQVGAYVIRGRLGAGGMGEVYLAEHRHIERRAAIKVLLPGMSAREDIVARFFAEARAASKIQHPGIVEILDCDVHEPTGRAYIVMEYLEGESLGATLARLGKLELGPALAIIGQIAGALEATHAKGIIHRDLKPDNVFLASTSTAPSPIAVKILDFGIAKLATEGQRGETLPGSLLGTPLYMSPEQCRGAGQIDHRADIYSLGCMTFEILSGRPPFVREGEGELIMAQITEAPPQLSTLEASVPSGLSHLVGSMLAKDPDARPQSMGEVVAAIERLAGSQAAQLATLIARPEPEGPRPPSRGGAPSSRRGSASRPLPPWSAGGTRLLPEASTTHNTTASEQVPARSRTGLAVVAVLAVAAGVMLALGPWRPWREGTPTATAPVAAAPAPEPRPTPTPDSPPALPRETVAAAPARPSVQIRVDSIPAGAELWLPSDAVARGRTPIKIAIPPGASTVEVILKAPDFRDQRVALGRETPEVVVRLQRATPAAGDGQPHRRKKASHREESPYRILDEK